MKKLLVNLSFLLALFFFSSVGDSMGEVHKLKCDYGQYHERTGMCTTLAGGQGEACLACACDEAGEFSLDPECDCKGTIESPTT